MQGHHPEEYKTYDQSKIQCHLPPVYPKEIKPKKDKECYFCPKRSRSDKSRIRHCKRRHDNEGCNLDALEKEPNFEYYSYATPDPTETAYTPQDYTLLTTS